MSTTTTYNGPVIQLAANYAPKTQASATVHVHASTSEDLSVNTVSAKRMQVFDMGGFNSQLPDGLVAENVTVTEEMNVVDNGRIKVQPSELQHTPIVVIGKTPNQSISEAGIIVNGNQREVLINTRHGVSAKKLMIVTDTIYAKNGNFHGTNRAATVSTKVIRPFGQDTFVTVSGDLFVTGKFTTKDQSVTS